MEDAGHEAEYQPCDYKPQPKDGDDCRAHTHKGCDLRPGLFVRVMHAHGGNDASCDAYERERRKPGYLIAEVTAEQTK